MPGANAQGMGAVKLGLEALTKALAAIPMGSDLHTALLKAVQDVSKHLTAEQPQPSSSDMVQQLAQMARQGQQGGANPMAAMMPGGHPPPPGGAPPPPSPGM